MRRDCPMNKQKPIIIPLPIPQQTPHITNNHPVKKATGTNPKCPMASAVHAPLALATIHPSKAITTVPVASTTATDLRWPHNGRTMIPIPEPMLRAANARMKGVGSVPGVRGRPYFEAVLEGLRNALSPTDVPSVAKARAGPVPILDAVFWELRAG